MSDVYSVTGINDLIKDFFDHNDRFFDVCIIGEVSNYKLYPSGHHYFSLKDDKSTLSCVMFKGNAYGLKFVPQNGETIKAYGSISSFPRDGKYQLYCKKIEKENDAGDLQKAFEELKARLSKEGLFDSSHKKALPVFPNTICVITSPSGAAVHDIIRVTGARWPLAKIVLIPVRVQGSEAPGEIIAALELANKVNAGDLIICGRGGGSAEDLWAFNDEGVARAIYASEIPVISAVGHEPDVSISDYVADAFAATPSNAAEKAVPDFKAVLNYLASYQRRLDPKVFIDNQRMNLDRYSERLYSYENRIISGCKQSFYKAASRLDAMSPLKVLERGYSVVSLNGYCVNNAGAVSEGDRVNIRFSSGNADCIVEKVNK